MPNLPPFEDWFTRAFGQPPIGPEEMAAVRLEHEQARNAFERNAKAVRWDHDRQIAAAAFVGDPEGLRRSFAEHEATRGPRPVDPAEQQEVDGAIQRGRLTSVLLNRQEEWNRMRALALAGWLAGQAHPPA